MHSHAFYALASLVPLGVFIEGKMKKVYIASPYTKGDVAVNVRRQLEVANHLMDFGFCPIVPLFTHFQHLVFPRKYEDWMAIDFEKIRGCDAFLRLDGESSGADREVKFAKELNIKVYYKIIDLIKGEKDES